MLPTSADNAKKVSDQLGSQPCLIKAGEYKFLASDSHSVCVGLNTVVRAEFDEKTVYNVTKGIVENLDKYQAAHRLLQKAVTVQSFTEKGLVPYHPGAEKYYKEKGLLK
jgi:TRAP-type uncharacterized transport system substrate-binding protein